MASQQMICYYTHFLTIRDENIITLKLFQMVSDTGQIGDKIKLNSLVRPKLI